jgi:hypothetical protein
LANSAYTLDPTSKSFLLLFFKKEDLPFPLPDQFIEMIRQLSPAGKRAIDDNGLHELRRVDEDLPALVRYVIDEYLRTPVPV